MGYLISELNNNYYNMQRVALTYLDLILSEGYSSGPTSLFPGHLISRPQQ